MLDIFDFIVEKGGNPLKIKESQRRRYASEEAVDEVIALYEDHRKSMIRHFNSSGRTTC
jgi:seryl-tRNA synthetase